jgi:hypothetical protein
MRAHCEIYQELDHDAEIHRADIAANGKLTVPVLASGGSAQTLAANYAPMCEQVALDVTGHLVPDAGHWGAEENPTISVACSFSSTARPEAHSGVGPTCGSRPGRLSTVVDRDPAAGRRTGGAPFQV